MARLTKLSPERLEELRKLRGDAQTADDIDVSPEMFFLAEFGYYFGWEGITALEGHGRGLLEMKDGYISLERAEKLLAATRKVWYLKLFEQSLGNYYASKDGKTFGKGIKTFTEKMKVEL